MDSFEFNSIKAEKSQAIRNYNRQKILKNLELFAALALFAWSSYNYIPVATKISAAFGQPLHVFIAVNLLIVFISVLSSQKPTKQEFYDEYVSITNSPRQKSVAADEHKTAPEAPVAEKHIVHVDNVVNSPVVKDCEGKAVRPVPESTVGAVSEVKKHRRTRSERVDDGRGNKGEMMGRSEPLMRSSTEVKMDDLSSEEFRMTIDTFIAAKKKTLIKENTHDLKLDQKHTVPLTYFD